MKKKKQKSCGKRFSPLQIKEMRDLFLEGYALNYIARHFDCRPVAVWNNVFDLSPPETFSKEKQKWAMSLAKVTISDVKKIRSRVPYGITAPEASKIFGISETTALAIIRGKTFRWISGWTRPRGNEFIYLRPIEMPKQIKKTDQVRGCKKGSKRSVKPGALIELAKKYKVSTSTICRWRSKGKIHI